MIKLSLLICSLNSRSNLLELLLNNINSQLTDEVEVLVESDDGKLETGEKRNILIDKAVGEYVAFIDDDDDISPNYIDSVLSALQSGPDTVSIIVNKNGQNLIFSADRSDATRVDGDTLHSAGYTNHLCPTKREIVSRLKFRHVSKYEDTDYIYRLYMSKLIKTQEYIDHPIYIYNYADVDKEYDAKERMTTNSHDHTNNIGYFVFHGNYDIQKFLDHTVDYNKYRHDIDAQRKMMTRINNIGIKTSALINPDKKTLGL